MSVEEKRIEAKRLLAKRMLEENQSSGVASSIGGGFNKGLAAIAGAPVDLMNAGLNLVGLGTEKPFGGSESIQGGMAELGLTVPPGQELQQPFVGRIAEEVGAASLPLGAFGAAARAGAQVPKFLKPALDAFRQTPKAFVAAEGAAATGAGVGAAVANEIAPDNPLAELAGQLIGGFTPSLVRSSPTARLAGKVKDIGATMTPQGAQNSAARSLQSVVDDPKAAADVLSLPRKGVPGSQLTPAQETQDPGLLRLERAIQRANIDVEGKFDDLSSRTSQAIREEAGGIGGEVPVERARDALTSRVERITEALNTRSAQAIKAAQDRIEKLAPGRSREEVNIIAREEVEKALDDAVRQEKDLWNIVDDEAIASTNTVKSRFSELLARRRKADDPEDIPPFVRRFLEGETPMFGDTEPVGELQAFRSRLLREARAERAKDAPNRRKIAVLEDLQEAALRDMEAANGGDDLKAALSFSRDLNQRFRQGAVGRLLGFERRGGVSVQPETTLERVLSKEGPEGAANLEAIFKATGESPQTKQAITDFIRNRFVMQATDTDGRVISGQAVRFLRRNKEVLDRFPELRQEMQHAIGSADRARRIVAASDARKSGLINKRTSKAALFLESPVDNEIRTVLNSKNPRETMNQLVRQVRRDTTGEAHKGLKHSFMMEMMKRSESKGVDAAGNAKISGVAMEKFFTENEAIIRGSGLFTGDEVKRISQIIDTAKRLEGAAIKGGRSLDDILDSSPDMMIDLVSRIVGANIGAQGAAGSTGAPLVAAGAGSRFVRNLTNKIPVSRQRDVLAQAVVDRDLMRDLLLRADTKAARKFRTGRLNAWLANALSEDDLAEQEEDQ